jgi:hypothetical protein
MPGDSLATFRPPSRRATIRAWLVCGGDKLSIISCSRTALGVPRAPRLSGKATRLQTNKKGSIDPRANAL